MTNGKFVSSATAAAILTSNLDDNKKWEQQQARHNETSKTYKTNQISGENDILNLSK